MAKKIRLKGHEFDFRFTKRLPRFPDGKGGTFMVDGYCEHHHSDHPKIRIRDGLDPFDELETIIHEILHAGAAQLSEETVTEIARETAKCIWDEHWRKLK